MRIDWKSLAKSEGYRSLKAALIKDVTKASRQQRPMRKKAEFYKLFRWVIARAKHYAFRKGVPIEVVLDGWESTRNRSWWLSHYGEHHQPKLPSGRPRNVRPSSEIWWSRDPISRFSEIRSRRRINAQNLRKEAGKPARWGAIRKKREAEYRERRNQSL